MEIKNKEKTSLGYYTTNIDKWICFMMYLCFDPPCSVQVKLQGDTNFNITI